MIDRLFLVEAAQFERDRRAGTYPNRIADGGDAEKLSIDFQCWVAIAEWLDTDRFFSFAGGADPERLDAPIIRWPELTAAAATAMTSLDRKIARRECDPEQSGSAPEARVPQEEWLGQLGALKARRARIFVIHRLLERMRDSVAFLNAELRKPSLTQEIAA